MTPDELRSIRHSLGLSAEAFAQLVKVESGRTVRRWESADRDIPGPVVVLATALSESQSVRNYFGVALKANSTR